jgi:hypothetical protein
VRIVLVLALRRVVNEDTLVLFLALREGDDEDDKGDDGTAPERTRTSDPAQDEASSWPSPACVRIMVSQVMLPLH